MTWCTKLMTPCDLEKIKERRASASQVLTDIERTLLFDDLPALIAEVEALRDDKEFMSGQVKALRAKLERAKAALTPFGRFGKAFLQFNHTPEMRSLPWQVIAAGAKGTVELSYYDLQRAKEALAELDKP